MCLTNLAWINRHADYPKSVRQIYKLHHHTYAYNLSTSAVLPNHPPAQLWVKRLEQHYSDSDPRSQVRGNQEGQLWAT